ncbi:hypothetical protein OG758_39385 [Streptomyces sp. NBC_01474]|uniref:hypothetical protein n=1 Tax=unclassified Streptomyces TaxID=2593676 RepID=UPI002DD8F686|nr:MULTISPECIES: hypothetical protein [unclassified Streptomyces]WSD99710.1 hypothetical protein OG758_39385 [Streptomyces sp. NBC_01474]
MLARTGADHRVPQPHGAEQGALQDQLGDASRWETAGAAWDSGCAVTPQEFYFSDLCHAPGWKTGGWTRWGLTDPVPRPCPECVTEAIPLLTIASAEWDPRN